MTFFAGRGKTRGSNAVVRNPNSFTFRKNMKTPQMQHRFINTQSVLVGNYGMVRGMKTPILTNNEMPHPYEVVTVPYDDGYVSAMDTDVMMTEDHDIWDPEAFAEPENIMVRNEGNMLKRKNSFPYPAHASSSSNTNANPYKESKVRYGLTAMGQQNSMKNINDAANSTPMRQTILCTDTPNGLGFKVNQKEKSVVEILKNSPKVCPRWSPAESPQKFKHKGDKKNDTYPRIFTVTVEKLQMWPKLLSCTEQIFELFGILEKTLDIASPKSKKMQLKSQNTRNRIICTFYEIDRPLPKLTLGQWQRCILLLRSNNEYQCLTVRSASADELMQFDKLTMDSSKSMAMILKSHNDNQKFF